MRAFYLGILIGCLIWIVGDTLRWLALQFTKKPTVCQCAHGRCHHERGFGSCHFMDPSDNSREWRLCTCQKYYFDPVHTATERTIAERNAADYLEQDK